MNDCRSIRVAVRWPVTILLLLGLFGTGRTQLKSDQSMGVEGSARADALILVATGEVGSATDIQIEAPEAMGEPVEAEGGVAADERDAVATLLELARSLLPLAGVLLGSWLTYFFLARGRTEFAVLSLAAPIEVDPYWLATESIPGLFHSRMGWTPDNLLEGAGLSDLPEMDVGVLAFDLKIPLTVMNLGNRPGILIGIHVGRDDHEICSFTVGSNEMLRDVRLVLEKVTLEVKAIQIKPGETDASPVSCHFQLKAQAFDSEDVAAPVLATWRGAQELWTRLQRDVELTLPVTLRFGRIRTRVSRSGLKNDASIVEQEFEVTVTARQSELPTSSSFRKETAEMITSKLEELCGNMADRNRRP